MPGKSSKTVPFTVRLPSELVERVKERAAKDGVSVATYVQQRLETWVDRPAKEIGGARVYTPTPDRRPVYTPPTPLSFSPLRAISKADQAGRKPTLGKKSA